MFAKGNNWGKCRVDERILWNFSLSFEFKIMEIFYIIKIK